MIETSLVPVAEEGECSHERLGMEYVGRGCMNPRYSSQNSVGTIGLYQKLWMVAGSIFPHSGQLLYERSVLPKCK